MKFYLLRVEPKKKMVFNPEESIDFHGFTGPFVQYTFARIQSVLRKVDRGSLTNDRPNNEQPRTTNLFSLEKELILTLEQYSQTIEQAATELNPSVIAGYIFHLAKTFNFFYTEHSIANAESEEKKQLRLQIATMTANVIKAVCNFSALKFPAECDFAFITPCVSHLTKYFT